MLLEAKLESSIPETLTEELLKRIPYVSEGIGQVRLLPDRSTVSFDLRSGFEGQEDSVRAAISEIAEKIRFNDGLTVSRTLVKRQLPAGCFGEDPHTSLLASRDIVEFGRGRYGFGPKLVALIEYFESRARAFAAELRAPQHAFPSLIGADVLDACRYLNNFPASLNLVSHLREDHATLQEFARSARCEKNRLVYDPQAASGVECLLSPSVCFHWYRWLRGTELAEPVAITALGKCFRYESSNLSGLERLWDFTMREIIFVGAAGYVLQNRDRLLAFSTAFLDDLGLGYEISTATDPFFLDNYAIQAAYQQGFELKYELLAPLPYNGKKLAVGSINYHQDFFGRSFSIQAEGAPAHTGCLGFGYERLALAFLAQHGLDAGRWPDAVTSAVRVATD